MSKYKEGIIYKGNLMEYKYGINEVKEKDMLFVYNEESDNFYSLIHTLNPSLDLLNPNITNEQKEKAKVIINKHKYPYINSGIEGSLFIDENSIMIEVKNKDSKIKK